MPRLGFGAFRCARPKSDPQAREAFESFAAKVQADLPDAVRGKKIEVWCRHKARVGRQGALTRIRAGRRDTGCEWTCIFGARRLSRTRRDRRAGHAIGKHRSHDLAEISKTVAEGAHAILAPDGAGRHGARALRVPDNITAHAAAALRSTDQPCRKRPGLPARQQDRHRPFNHNTPLCK